MSYRGTPYYDMATDAGARGDEREQMAAMLEDEDHRAFEAADEERTREEAEWEAYAVAEQMAGAQRTLRVGIVAVLAGPSLAVTDADGRGAALPIREELAQRLREEYPGAYDFMYLTFELTLDGVYVVEARKVEP